MKLVQALRVVSYAALICGIVLVVLGLIAPSDYHIERTTVINAPKELVFPHVRYWTKWRAWSPWAERDPTPRASIS